MKRVSLFVAALAVAGMVAAQGQVPYHPFVAEGKVWNCEDVERLAESVDGAYVNYLQTTTFGLRINGDTVIGGQTYKKVYKDVATVDRQLLYVSPEEAKDAFAESEHKEVNTTTLYDVFMRAVLTRIS